MSGHSQNKLSPVPADQVIPRFNQISTCKLAIDHVMGWNIEDIDMDDLATGEDINRMQAAKELILAVYKNPDKEISGLIFDGTLSDDTERVLLRSIMPMSVANNLIGKRREDAQQYFQESAIVPDTSGEVEVEICSFLDSKFGRLKPSCDLCITLLDNDFSGQDVPDEFAEVISEKLDTYEQKMLEKESDSQSFKGAVMKVYGSALNLMAVRAGGELPDIKIDRDFQKEFTPSGEPVQEKIDSADRDLEQSLGEACTLKTRIPRPFHEAINSSLQELAAIAHIARADSVLTRERALNIARSEGLGH